MGWGRSHADRERARTGVMEEGTTPSPAIPPNNQQNKIRVKRCERSARDSRNGLEPAISAAIRLPRRCSWRDNRVAVEVVWSRYGVVRSAVRSTSRDAVWREKWLTITFSTRKRIGLRGSL